MTLTIENPNLGSNTAARAGGGIVHRVIFVCESEQKTSGAPQRRSCFGALGHGKTTVRVRRKNKNHLLLVTDDDTLSMISFENIHIYPNSIFHNSSEHELTRRKHPSVKDWRAWSILALSAYRGSRSTRKKSTTRREAPFELPWADWDDLRRSGYLDDVFSTLVVPDYDKRGPQPPEPILGDF